MHRRTRALSIGIAAAAILVAGVEPVAASESTIQPGVSIGKVKLGMTRAQVVRALGRDYLVDKRESGYLELGWDFSSLTVGLRRGRVVLVSTTVHAQRTTTGAGPGAPWLEVVHAYPGGRCTFNFVNYSWRLEYLVPHRGGTQTLFVFREIYDSDKAAVTGYEALEVSVRTPYERLPEYAPGWRDQCGDGWAQAKVPQLRQK